VFLIAKVLYLVALREEHTFQIISQALYIQFRGLIKASIQMFNPFIYADYLS
jgi:hypothetical protein